MELKRLRLGRNEERRLQGGHLWVYSNEVNNAVTPLKAFAPGELALVEVAWRQAYGRGLRQSA